MKINSITRKAIAEKLASAIKREGLTKNEASILFNMKPDRISKFLNDNHRDFIADRFVEKFREWSNSGESLRVYAKKHNFTWFTPSQPGSVERDKIEPESKPAAVVSGGTSGKPEEVLSKDELDKIEPTRTIKFDGGASLQEISKLLDEKLSKQPDVLLATIEETESKDRLGIILDVINEVKELGFDIDLHISPATK